MEYYSRVSVVSSNGESLGQKWKEWGWGKRPTAVQVNEIQSDRDR